MKRKGGRKFILIFEYRTLPNSEFAIYTIEAEANILNEAPITPNRGTR